MVKELLLASFQEFKSKEFSILADEIGDCSNTKQMSFVIRFINKSCQIREEFIQLLECESGTYS